MTTVVNLFTAEPESSASIRDVDISSFQHFMKQRIKYMDTLNMTPSNAHGKTLATIRDFYYPRPREQACDIPITLMHPVFNQFLDDWRSSRPTLIDHELARELIEEMCKLYSDENKHKEVFWR